MSTRATKSLLAALTLSAGCLGGEPGRDESSASAASLRGFMLDERMVATAGWNPTGWLSLSARGEMDVEHFNPSSLVGSPKIVRVVGTRVALRPPSQGVLELSAQALSFWKSTGAGIQTELAVALYHRPRGSTYEWRSVRCPSIHSHFADLPSNDTHDLYNGPTTVDLRARTIRTGISYGPAFDYGWYDDTFDRCGIKEAEPEFSMFVVPMISWHLIVVKNSFAGHYSYSLQAACDGSYCRPYADVGGPLADDESAGPDPANPPEVCADGTDNDGNGLTDCDDEECKNAVRWFDWEDGARSGMRICPSGGT